MIIVCTILDSDHIDTSLFDSSSSFSYVYLCFLVQLDMACGLLDVHVRISIPIVDSMIVDMFCCSCPIFFKVY